jgi:hypothetical protein
MPNLEKFKATFLSKPVAADEYIPIQEIEAWVLAVDIDEAERVALAWGARFLPFHRLDSIA